MWDLQWTPHYYINEALCPARRKVFTQARAVKRDKCYEYLWVRSGNIQAYMWKEENDPVIQVRNLTELSKLQKFTVQQKQQF